MRDLRQVNRPGFVEDFILWRQVWSHGKTSEMVCLRQSENYEFDAKVLAGVRGCQLTLRMPVKR
jgi:hypothetical protein